MTLPGGIDDQHRLEAPNDRFKLRHNTRKPNRGRAKRDRGEGGGLCRLQRIVRRAPPLHGIWEHLTGGVEKYDASALGYGFSLGQGLPVVTCFREARKLNLQAILGRYSLNFIQRDSEEL